MCAVTNQSVATQVPWVRVPGLVLVLGWVWRLVKPVVLLWWQGWKTLSVNGLGGETRPVRTRDPMDQGAEPGSGAESVDDRVNERPARVGWVA